LQVPGLPQLKGGLVFANNDHRSPYNIDPMNFGPRIGLAYHTLGNIVIRAGYGIFYDAIKGAASGTGNGGFMGFNFNTPLVTTYGNDGATPGARISNPLPSGPQLPPGSSQGLLSFVGLGVSGPISTWNNTPYMQTWNFGLQREFKGNILLDVNYLGTKGTHLCFGGAGSINYLGPWVEDLSAAQIAQQFVRAESVLWNHTTRQQPFQCDSCAVAMVEAISAIHRLERERSRPWAIPAITPCRSAWRSASQRIAACSGRMSSKSLDNTSVACGCTTLARGRDQLAGSGTNDS
jgi:hypothetical protein